jgi:hypothetical protein
MSGVLGVCSRAAWLRSLVWCVSSAGPPECEAASSLAYIKSRLKPNPFYGQRLRVTILRTNEANTFCSPASQAGGRIYAPDAQT